MNNNLKFQFNKLYLKKNLSEKLIVQLGSLALITIAGPLIVVLLFIRQGNL